MLPPNVIQNITVDIGISGTSGLKGHFELTRVAVPGVVNSESICREQFRKGFCFTRIVEVEGSLLLKKIVFSALLEPIFMLVRIRIGRVWQRLRPFPDFHVDIAWAISRMACVLVFGFTMPLLIPIAALGCILVLCAQISANSGRCRTTWGH